MYNLKLALRNLYRNALYTWINIVGLAVSLTAAIFILLWVQDEWNYDKFYDRTDDIYMLYGHSMLNGQENYSNEFPMILARTIESELGEVEAATVMGYSWSLSYVDYNGVKFFGEELDFTLVDTCFFNVFNMLFIEGNSQNAFRDASSIVITDELSKILFEEESALGKGLKGSNGKEYFVSAVVKRPPQNSAMKFKCLIPSEDLYGRTNEWYLSSASMFVLLRPDANPKAVADKITEVHKSHYSRLDDSYPHILQPLTKQHLYAPDGSETGMKNVRLYLFTAIVLLAIASINYVNLVTARAGKKIKEIGLRKIMGANRWQLFIQMMNETIIILFVSFCFATILLYILTPYYSIVTGKYLAFNLLNSDVVIFYLICFLFIATLAGIYPALYISSFNPLSVFKVGLFKSTSRFSFRSILIVLQFACSVAFILATIVMSSQQKYMQTKNLGYNRENILMIINDTPNRDKLYEAYKVEFAHHPSIIGITASTVNILDVTNFSSYSLNGTPKDPTYKIAFLGVDRDFFNLLDIEFVEGSGFTGTTADSLDIFINETAAKRMGIEKPLDTNIEAWTVNGKITGVIKDFHFAHMSNPVAPILLYLLPSKHFWTIYIKTAPGKAAEAIAAAEQVWKKYESEYPFVYEFMDETFDIMYRDDIRTGYLFNAFAIVAIFISCLGLFGLATYTAETRTKEIGIRKTLGASTVNIIGMLSREFVALAGIACAIGIPIAYYFMNKMLQSYAYHTSITWWMILATILAVLILTILTVIVQALRAARANPVKSIKTE